MIPQTKSIARYLANNLLMLVLLTGSGFAFADDNFWQDATLAARSLNTEISSIRYFNSDEQALRDFLYRVPSETSGITAPTINLPMPDGSLASYRIVESSIMEDELAAKYPEIKTFRVYGIDDPVASGRADISPKGFRAMLHTSQGRVFIDPDSESFITDLYMARKRDSNQSHNSFKCSAGKMQSSPSSMQLSSRRTLNRVAGNLLTYRLAVSATLEYAIAVNQGGPLDLVDDAFNEIMNAINRVNSIYERDLGIRLELVAGSKLLIEDTNTANLTNTDQNLLMIENQAWIESKINSADYDIGHIFSTSDGGVAFLNSVCDGSNKSRGVTGLPDPVGDMFYIDFVAHEIGHQFGADHSFNSTTLACGVFGNRNASTAFEPGSGSTIMSYAGICGVEDIQDNGDATFHAGSIAQIVAFTTDGGGSSCKALQATGNTDPVNVDAGVDRIIPLVTAFKLEGSGSDVDIPADTLLFQWDQMDVGVATNASTLGGDFGNNPLFRSYVPQLSGDRDFPALGTQVRDGPFDLSEALPCTSRTLKFRLTVRDGKSGQDSDDVRIHVDSKSGPFRITSHNDPGTIIVESTPSTILTWAVANTDLAPVSCPKVDIDLLTFDANHANYSALSLAKGADNNGIATVLIGTGMALHPSNSHARFRVKCSNNIFYDISDADIDIQGSMGNFPVNGNKTFFNENGQLFATSNSSCQAAPMAPIAPVALVSGGGGGGGAMDKLWILFLLGLIVSSKPFGRQQPGLASRNPVV